MSTAIWPSLFHIGIRMPLGIQLDTWLRTTCNPQYFASEIDPLPNKYKFQYYVDYILNKKLFIVKNTLSYTMDKQKHFL